MVALGCDRCVKAHHLANLACAGATGVRRPRRRGTLYSAKTGVELGRYTLRLDATGTRAYVTRIAPPPAPLAGSL